MHPYYYMRNGRNDVIGLFDASGTIVARYTYDSWGNLLKITDGSGNDKTNNTAFVGYKNPLRYRGYYYDSETKLYYLQSRYYNPEWGKFINAHDVDTVSFDLSVLTDKNLFAYTDNNPVNRYDPSGYCWNELAEKALEAAFICSVVAITALAVAGTGGAAAVVMGPVLAAVITSAASTTLAVAGGLVAVAVGSATISYIKPTPMLPKGSKTKNDHNKHNNQAQNKEFDAVCKELKLTKNQREILHREVSHMGMGYSELRGTAISLFL